MADCYYHGYSGGPGPCYNCEQERRYKLEAGTLGLSIPSDEVVDMANVASIGRKAVAEQLKKDK